MSEWQDISTAQTRGSYRHRDGHARTWTEAPTVDVLAKRWNIDTDAMEFRRFSDCRFEDKCWRGVDEGWRPVAWMPLPTIPTEWPPLETKLDSVPDVPTVSIEFGDPPERANRRLKFDDDKEIPF